FQNGGSEAYVVRVAQGALSAKVTMRNSNTAGTAVNVLDVAAASAGTWGNSLQIDVDYNTVNPASFFNLTVTEFVNQNGKRVPGRKEVFRNLSMNSQDSHYAVDTINASSQLIHVDRPSALTITGNGSAASGTLSATVGAGIDAAHSNLGVIVNGRGPFP